MGIEIKLQRRVEYGKQVELKVNVAKTKFKVLKVYTVIPELFSIDGGGIQAVEYFGRILVKTCIRKAR